MVGCAALLFLYLVGNSSIPGLGWIGLKTSIPETVAKFGVAALPGFLVGFASRPGRRLLPILVTLIIYLALIIPPMAYFWMIGMVVIPPVFLLIAGLGVWARRLTRGRVSAGALLSVLASLIVGLAFYLWFVDGWHFILMDTDEIARVGFKRPVLIPLPTEGDWWEGLEQAFENSMARGDVERARRILPALERAAFVTARNSFGSQGLANDDGLAKVAGLYVAVGNPKRASNVMVEMRMAAAKRPFVFLSGQLRKGDFQAATAIAHGLPDPDRSRAYYQIAHAQAKGGGYSDAIATITQHPGDGQMSAFSDIAEVAFLSKRADQTSVIFLAGRGIVEARPYDRQRDLALAAIVVAQDYYSLFDDAEKTAAMIQSPEVRAQATTHLRDPAIFRPR